MEQRYLILVDEQSQEDRLKRIARSLRNEGILLVYEEINPNECSVRKDNGDLSLDKVALENKLASISFLSHLDVFATDYYLVTDELKGIDMIEMLYSLQPHYRKQVVIYSAQIDEVIDDIITKRAKGFKQQVEMLKILAQTDIHYLSGEGEFENEFKSLIAKEPDITIDSRLIDSLHTLNFDNLKCSIPGYTDKKISDIGDLLLKKGSDVVALRKNIVDHILAYITSINGYE